MRAIDLEKDYKTLEKWWKSYSWPCIAPEYLPTTGLIIDDLCAGFLYKTDSSVAILEWIVGNREADRGARAQAIREVVQGLKEIAHRAGYTKVFTSAVHPNLISAYKELGFQPTDSNVQMFMYSIGDQ